MIDPILASQSGLSNRSETAQLMLKHVQDQRRALQAAQMDDLAVETGIQDMLASVQSVFNDTVTMEQRAQSFLQLADQVLHLAAVFQSADPAFFDSISEDSKLYRRKKAQGVPLLDQLNRLGTQSSASSSFFMRVKDVGFGNTTTISDSLKSEIEEMIRGILENGIEDSTELRNLMLLLGILGMHIDVFLLEEIGNAISDYVRQMAASASDFDEFTAFLDTVQAMVSGDLMEFLPEEANMEATYFSDKGTASELTDGDVSMTDSSEVVSRDASSNRVSSVQQSDAKVSMHLQHMLTRSAGLILSTTDDGDVIEQSDLEGRGGSSKVSASSETMSGGSGSDDERKRVMFSKIGDALDEYFDAAAGFYVEDVLAVSDAFIHRQLELSANDILASIN